MWRPEATVTGVLFLLLFGRMQRMSNCSKLPLIHNNNSVEIVRIWGSQSRQYEDLQKAMWNRNINIKLIKPAKFSEVIRRTFQDANFWQIDIWELDFFYFFFLKRKKLILSFMSVTTVVYFVQVFPQGRYTITILETCLFYNIQHK